MNSVSDGCCGDRVSLWLQAEGVEVLEKPSKTGWSQTLPVKSEKDAVKISLQDCLACSGCVTSAETVLLEHQSIGEA